MDCFSWESESVLKFSVAAELTRGRCLLWRHLHAFQQVDGTTGCSSRRYPVRAADNRISTIAQDNFHWTWEHKHMPGTVFAKAICSFRSPIIVISTIWKKELGNLP